MRHERRESHSWGEQLWLKRSLRVQRLWQHTVEWVRGITVRTGNKSTLSKWDVRPEEKIETLSKMEIQENHWIRNEIKDRTRNI